MRERDGQLFSTHQPPPAPGLTYSSVRSDMVSLSNPPSAHQSHQISDILTILFPPDGLFFIRMYIYILIILFEFIVMIVTS